MSRLPSPDEVRALRSARRTISATIPVRHSAAEIYPYLTQVDLYNRAAGSSPVTYDVTPSADGASLFRATARKAGVAMRYVELPYEWETPRFVHGELFFENGPFLYGRIRGEYDEALRAVRYIIDYVPRGRFSLAGLLARLLLRRFSAIVRGIDVRVPDRVHDPMAVAGFADRSPDQLRRAGELARAWSHLAPDPVVAETLADLVLTGPDRIIGRMRPYAVARQLGTERSETLQFCMRAAEAGFLEFQWDFVCPSCGGARRRARTIAELGEEAHCDVCNIRYAADLHRNVEVSFRPASSLRAIDAREFCIQSPSHQRLILAQVNVESRGTARLTLELTPGHYRLRTVGRDGEMLFDAVYGRPRQEVVADVTNNLDGSAVQCGATLDLVVKNDAQNWRTIRFEHHGYREDAATAADVAAMPELRHIVGDVADLLDQSAARYEAD
ncbi:MAG TPA: DUF5939 domain-containing protein [Thermoanaerobaculia bacterium]